MDNRKSLITFTASGWFRLHDWSRPNKPGSFPWSCEGGVGAAPSSASVSLYLLKDTFGSRVGELLCEMKLGLFICRLSAFSIKANQSVAATDRLLLPVREKKGAFASRRRESRFQSV